MTAVDTLVYARCAGFISRAPGFSHASVPMPMRAGLALVLTVGVVPSIAAHPAFDSLALIVAIVAEFVLGAAIGLAAAILFDGVAAGGSLVDNYIGVGSLSPGANVDAGEGFGKLWGLGILASFFALGGYQVVIYALAVSFVHVPPGGILVVHDMTRIALAVPSSVAHAALLVSGPAIAVCAVVNIALASVGRVIPRFGNMTLAFPMVFMAALLVTMAIVPAIYALAGRPILPLPRVH